MSLSWNLIRLESPGVQWYYALLFVRTPLRSSSSSSSSSSSPRLSTLSILYPEALFETYKACSNPLDAVLLWPVPMHLFSATSCPPPYYFYSLGHTLSGTISILRHFRLLGMAEMVTFLPLSSPFIRLAGRFVDDAFGVAAGYNFFVSQIAQIPFEIVACNIIINYWTDAIPVGAIVAIVIVLYMYVLSALLAIDVLMIS